MWRSGYCVMLLQAFYQCCMLFGAILSQSLQILWQSAKRKPSIKALQCNKFIISSREHEVLKVSYCDQSMWVVHCPLCVERRQQLLSKPTPPTPLGQLTRNLVGSIRVTCRWKITNIVPIRNPRWPPSWKSIFCFSSWTERPSDSKLGRKHRDDL